MTRYGTYRIRVEALENSLIFTTYKVCDTFMWIVKKQNFGAMIYEQPYTRVN
jgi:hypothetical protein